MANRTVCVSRDLSGFFILLVRQNLKKKIKFVTFLCTKINIEVNYFEIINKLIIY